MAEKSRHDSEGVARVCRRQALRRHGEWEVLYPQAERDRRRSSQRSATRHRSLARCSDRFRRRFEWAGLLRQHVYAVLHRQEARHLVATRNCRERAGYAAESKPANVGASRADGIDLETRRESELPRALIRRARKFHS